jgi:hypothetical protein
VPANQWVSEGAVQFTFLSFAWAWALTAQCWLGMRTPFGRRYFRPLFRWNLCWALVMTGALAGQIRAHLWQIGLLPMPFR